MRPMRGDDHVVQRRRIHRHSSLESARGAACRRGAAAGQGLPDRLPGNESPTRRLVGCAPGRVA